MSTLYFNIYIMDYIYIYIRIHIDLLIESVFKYLNISYMIYQKYIYIYKYT